MTNEFITADSITVMAALENQSVDIVLTDPPYPNGAKLFRDTICDGYAGLYLACKKARRHVVFFWSPRHERPTAPPGWYEVARHVWAKPDAKSNTAYEEIVVWGKDWKHERSKYWEIPILDYRTYKDLQDHPTQKPVKLVRYLLDLYTNEGDLVLDPFAGTGTTALACLQTKRQYIAIESNPEYAKAAKARLAQKALRDYEQPAPEAAPASEDVDVDPAPKSKPKKR